MKSVIRQISEIQGLSLAELRDRWRALYGTSPPGYSREHLVRRLCYRVQELAYGGLSDLARAELRAHLGADLNANGTRLERRGRKDGLPVPGTLLIREWRGRRYEVTCVAGGFELEGRLYRSLTSITKAITGQHWNGPAFFGLRKPARRDG